MRDRLTRADQADGAGELDTGDWVVLTEPIGGFFHPRFSSGTRGMVIANNTRADGTFTVCFYDHTELRLRPDQLALAS
jgi:hypothetical protein